MFDAAASPDDENVARTRAVADEVREQGIYVEAELGEIGGKGGAHTPGVRTDPGDAADFVARTGVDAVPAVAVGSSHAMTSATARLDVALIETIAVRVPVPLVLHGSSGVPNEDIREAIAAGMAKVDIGTALNVAFTGAVRRHLAEHGGVDHVRIFGTPGAGRCPRGARATPRPASRSGWSLRENGPYGRPMP